MELPAELVEYLTHAAHGEESDCPPDVDVYWHACLANPQEYEAWCLEFFGVVLEHVVDKPGECHARRRC
jgi:hypothetical protein